MNRKLLCISPIVLSTVAVATFANTPIVISDGPSSAISSNSKNAPVVTTDGPGSAGSANKHTIITTDGPVHPAYSYPLPIIISDGPSELPYHTVTSIETSDGPGARKKIQPQIATIQQPIPPIVHEVFILDAPEQTYHQKHAEKKLIAKAKHHALPSAEESTLAPAVPVKQPMTNLPVATPFSSPSERQESTFALIGKIALSLVALSLVAFGSFWGYKRCSHPE